MIAITEKIIGKAAKERIMENETLGKELGAGQNEVRFLQHAE
jgi:hypothetical protein